MLEPCFIYLRVSGKAQVKGDGFLRQFLSCRAYAEQNNLKIVKIFREKGVSGTKELEDRPALTALFSAFEDDGVKVLVIEKLDRMARDLMVQETIVQDMQKNGYRLCSTCEPDLNSDEPSRILIRQIFGALAQWERAMTVIKLRGARNRIKARGSRCEGQKPFGEHPKKPKESEALSMMRSLRSAGLTFDQIADALNAKNVPSRKGGKWQGCTINKILKREAA